MTGSDRAGAEKVNDERISIAVYFDEEMRLLCQLPAAARALRRDLVSDMAQVLG